jgi:peptidoglycan-N-acetylglucosamine deacetylase
MRLFRPSFISDYLFPEAISRIRTTEKVLCLTIDDGPDPYLTLQLLKILARHKVTSVFFCEGRASEKYPDLINQIKTEGHIIGNHGYHHLDGWMTSSRKYLADIRQAAQFTSNELFRPPHGHLRLRQYESLIKTYRIILWDIMPYDFDRRFGSRNSMRVLKRKIRPGSVIVLHNSPESTILEFLEEFILYALEGGYRFDLSGLIPERST